MSVSLHFIRNPIGSLYLEHIQGNKKMFELYPITSSKKSRTVIVVIFVIDVFVVVVVVVVVLLFFNYVPCVCFFTV